MTTRTEQSAITWITEQHGIRKYTVRRNAHAPHKGWAFDTRWEIVRVRDGRCYNGKVTRRQCIRKIERLEAGWF